MTMPGRNFNAGSGYRYGFNGKENDKDISEGGQDYGMRIYDSRLGKFLSVDRFANKFPSYSPYQYAGNMPISAIDKNGDSIYIVIYTIGNTKHEENEMFEASALTRKKDIQSQSSFNKSKDIVIVLGISDLADIKKEVEKNVNSLAPVYGNTAEVNIFSHSAYNGVCGTVETSNEFKLDYNQMSPEGWNDINFNWSTKGARLNIFGCNSATNHPQTGISFVQDLSSKSNFKDVDIAGQPAYCFPSQFVNVRIINEDQNDGNFILGKKESQDGKSTLTQFYPTYLVGSLKRSEDFLLNEQKVVYPMRHFKNGKENAKEFQQGTKKL